MKRTCPQEEVLADYLAGCLSDVNITSLESHLADCPQCLDEIMIIEKLVQNNDLSANKPVPAAVTESAISLVKDSMLSGTQRIMKRSSQIFRHMTSWISMRAPLFLSGRDSLAPVRSSEKTISNDLFQVRKAFREIITDIEIEKTGPQNACMRINLVKDSKNQNNIRVTLLDVNEREMASFPLSNGFVIFEDIPFGRFCLAFVRNGTRIGMYRFEIKDSSNAKK
jgi:hypothetical protein